jgi:hypothetical protein
VEGYLPFDVVDMLDECSLEGWMSAKVEPWGLKKLTKDTDGQVLGHRARLDSHFVGRAARFGSICI